MTPRRRHKHRSLVERLRRGDERAWAAWYDELAGPIRGYARSKGAMDPDDVVGDVFAAAAARIGDFTGTETDLRSWLFTIAHHHLVDEHRRRSRRHVSAVPVTDLDHLAYHRDTTADSDRRLDAQGALQLLDLLTEDQREVLVLRAVAGLSLRETALVTGREPGAIKALQHRSIARIHRHIGDEAYPLAVGDDRLRDA